MRKVNLAPRDTVNWDEVKAALKAGGAVLASVYDNRVGIVMTGDNCVSYTTWENQIFCIRRGLTAISSRTDGWDAFVAKVSKGGCGELLLFESGAELAQYIRDNKHLTL